jgi:hypothetical protein
MTLGLWKIAEPRLTGGLIGVVLDIMRRVRYALDNNNYNTEELPRGSYG